MSALDNRGKRCLTPQQADKVRRIYAEDGLSFTALAKRFRVSRSTIQKVLQRLAPYDGKES